MNIKRVYKRITLYGLVQGIGFRPYVVHLAQKWGIEGAVCNSGGGVIILASAEKYLTESFTDALQNDPHSISQINHVKIENLNAKSYEDFLNELDFQKVSHPSVLPSFRIGDSRDEDGGMVILPPDLPVCEPCLLEMKDPNNRRYKHPLISCTHCGPRYSIIQKTPYDRCNTTMRQFDFCPDCLAEYSGVESRRFHAQTISCLDCGPQLKFIIPRTTQTTLDREEELTGEAALLKTIQVIRQGGVAAVKGIGGYHFIASPYLCSAVKSLRDLKKREQKPFAVCFPDMDAIRKYTEISPKEEELLTSVARPIVLLERKELSDQRPFSSLVLQNSRFIGAFLPYTAILVRLCESLGPLIATSANISDAPIINREKDLNVFSDSLFGGILTHDRKIVISQDDSVARVICEKTQLTRRARGYTPLPIYVAACEGQQELSVMALGGELKSSFCLQKGPFAYVSQYLGDLGSRESMKIYRENLGHMKALMKIEPSIAACDLHPDYATTRLAEESGIPVIKVQHHHAHIGSVMAEKGLEGPVLGVAFDGTGFGSDGTIWGGEFLICNHGEFTRAAYLKPVPLLSGDDSMKDCQKTATAYLHAFGLKEAIRDSRYSIIGKALDSGVNTILNSSAGRLFDAVSSIMGLGAWNRYEGEGAIHLENAASRALKRNASLPLAFELIEKSSAFMLDAEPLIKQMARILIKETPSDKLTEELALGFHRALCTGILDVLAKLRVQTGILDVVLSGGVFQNKILTEMTVGTLESRGFRVHIPALVPTNDGGISLGQAFIAMEKIKQMG